MLENCPETALNQLTAPFEPPPQRHLIQPSTHTNINHINSINSINPIQPTATNSRNQHPANSKKKQRNKQRNKTPATTANRNRIAHQLPSTHHVNSPQQSNQTTGKSNARAAAIHPAISATLGNAAWLPGTDPSKLERFIRANQRSVPLTLIHGIEPDSAIANRMDAIRPHQINKKIYLYIIIIIINNEMY